MHKILWKPREALPITIIGRDGDKDFSKKRWQLPYVSTIHTYIGVNQA